jgi:rare lipoprotein A
VKRLAPLLFASLLFASMMSASGCGRRHSVRVPVPPTARAGTPVGTTETGIASWYGVPYDGRRSASGEIYDMQQLTAAHRTLPFQTWVNVTNLANGKQVDVRIIDRGPFVEGRIIDLSLAAAREIDMVRSGTTRVRLRVIEHPPAAASTAASSPGGYAVQAGAFSDPARAEALRGSLTFPDARVEPAIVKPGEPPMWRVLVGQGLTKEAADALVRQVGKVSGQALVVSEK